MSRCLQVTLHIKNGKRETLGSCPGRATFFFCFFDSYANRATEQHGQQITVLQQGFSFVQLTSTKRVNWRQMSVWLAFTP